MTPAVLLLIFLLLAAGGSVASLTCSPASVCSQGPSCSEVHSVSEENCFQALVSKGTAGDGDECAPCSFPTEFGSLPKPADLTLSVRPHSTTHFELLVSWSPPSGAEDLEGYKINIYAPPAPINGGFAPEKHYGCHCATSNDTEKKFEVTYSYQNQYQDCEWDTKRTLAVDVISVPYSAVNTDPATSYITWPTDCLSIEPPDYAICGPPIPNPPKTTWITELLPSSPGFMEVTLEWEEPDNAVPGYTPSEYFILFGPDFSSIVYFRVKNATSITISPLSASVAYLAFIEVYLPCVRGNQICTDQMTDLSCGQPNKIGTITYEPSPSSSATSIGISTYTFSPKPTTSATLSPLPPTSLTGRSSSSLFPSSPSVETAPSTNAPFPTTVKLALVVGGSCLASILLIIIFLVVTMFLVRRRCLCWKKYPDRFRIPPNSPTDSERSTPSIYPNCIISNGFEFPDSSGSTPKAGNQQQQLHKILQTLSPSPDVGELTVQPHSPNRDEQDSVALSDPSKHRVVFIYSDQTPKEDCDLIAVYRRKLESQGDITTSIYDVSFRQPTSTWLAEEVRVANAVFCVCNKEFQRDWQNGGGSLSRSPVHALKLQVDSFVNSRLHPAMLFAVMVLYESDVQYVPEGSYLKAAVNFHLCEEKLGEIIRFIRQEREYILPS